MLTSPVKFAHWKVFIIGYFVTQMIGENDSTGVTMNVVKKKIDSDAACSVAAAVLCVIAEAGWRHCW